MDKFTIFVDPQDRFRIRLHRFKHRKRNGGVVDRPHSHKWHSSTIVLSGAYCNTTYRIDSIDEKYRTATLVDAGQTVFGAGTAASFEAFVPHRAVNEAEDVQCLTMFVRGPSLSGVARIFDIDAGTFYETLAARQQLRVAIRSMGQLDASFH